MLYQCINIIYKLIVNFKKNSKIDLTNLFNFIKSGKLIKF